MLFELYLSFEETRDTFNCIGVRVSIVPLTEVEHEERRVYFRIKVIRFVYSKLEMFTGFESGDF